MILASVAAMGISLATAAVTPRVGDRTASSRTYLEVHKGRYFQWSAPPGWRSSETMNGVDLFSPDQSESAGFSLLLRSRGVMSPTGWCCRRWCAAS